MITEKLFHLMAEKRASDIFITIGMPIQIKIQGACMPVNNQIVKPDVMQKIIGELLTKEQEETFNRERELNISRGMRGLGNFRINLFRQRSSTAIVVRYVQGDIPELESLGLPSVLKEMVLEKRGLILMVGSTGSGKSTTIASMLNYRNARMPGHILTVEDPIEFLFKHNKSMVNQREVGIDTDGWLSALKNAMRQAPDCIMIGEIRDRETMRAAISYAQTGHLCISTLHANNAYFALNRIVNFFPQDARDGLLMDLAVTLIVIISQRLVRRPDGRRLAACEIMLNNTHISELILRGEIASIKEQLDKKQVSGSQTFEQDLLRLYRNNEITLDEALVNSDSPTNLTWLIDNTEAIEAGDATQINNSLGNLSDQNSGGPSFQEFKLDVEDHAEEK